MVKLWRILEGGRVKGGKEWRASDKKFGKVAAAHLKGQKGED